MNEIREYKCTYSNSVGISAEVTEGLGLEFPEIRAFAKSMGAEVVQPKMMGYYLLLQQAMFYLHCPNRQMLLIPPSKYIQKQNIWEIIARVKQRFNLITLLQQYDQNIMGILNLDDYHQNMVELIQKNFYLA